MIFCLEGLNIYKAGGEMLDTLTTEQAHHNSSDIGQMSTEEIVHLINQQDALVAQAIKLVLPSIAMAVDDIVSKFKMGGRLFYVGAGTSGRLGVLDAAECPPTFSTSPGQVQGILAGGSKAFVTALEGAEDNPQQAIIDLSRKHLHRLDVVVGISASGRTPYVIGALEYAQQVEATTIALSCNQNAEISKYAYHIIEVVVGPEVVAGSTRMKAATAQKMILNMLSTTAMIKLGKVYRNRMVDLQATNSKLQERACNIVMALTGVTRDEAQLVLGETYLKVKPALVMIMAGVTADVAQACLQDTQGFVDAAVVRARSLP